MTMPPVPGVSFGMIEAEFVLGGLQIFFDPPARSFHADQNIDCRAVRAPGGEIRAEALRGARSDYRNRNIAAVISVTALAATKPVSFTWAAMT